MDEIDAIVQGDIEHPRVEGQCDGQGGCQAKDDPFQGGAFDQGFGFHFVAGVVLCRVGGIVYPPRGRQVLGAAIDVQRRGED